MNYQQWDELFKIAFDIIAVKVQATKKRKLARPEEKSLVTAYDWIMEPAYCNL